MSETYPKKRTVSLLGDAIPLLDELIVIVNNELDMKVSGAEVVTLALKHYFKSKKMPTNE